MLNHKLLEKKVFKDAIYGYIYIEYQIIWDLINTKEFQRLRRIKQLGGTYMVFHCGEHSRFGHCLGSYEIIRKIIELVDDIKLYLNENEQIKLLISALLHDLGHLPYSHCFENVLNINHELYTTKIIKSNSDISNVLNKYKLNQDIINILNHQYENQIMSNLISSQLDCDRMDYLLRDSYFTGVNYGNYDIERIIRTIRIKDNKVLIKESGLLAIQDYILSRYNMFSQVYYHPNSRSYEILYKLLFKRIKDLNYQCIFNKYINNKDITNKLHYQFDDNYIGYGLIQLSTSNDNIIKDLSNRLLNRDLFVSIKYNLKNYIRINNLN